MKKILLTFAAILLFTTLTSAQGFKGGAGLAYGTDISTVGISANGLYEINKQWEIGGSFIFFFEKDLVSWKALNVNAHYILSDNDGMKFYGLAGANLTLYSIDIPEVTFGGISVGGGETTGSNFGVNLGAGTRKELSKSVELFGEAQYTISDGSYLTANVGVLFKF